MSAEAVQRRRETARSYIASRVRAWLDGGCKGEPLSDLDLDRLVALMLGVNRVLRTEEELVDAVLSAWIAGELDLARPHAPAERSGELATTCHCGAVAVRAREVPAWACPACGSIFRPRGE